MLLNTNKKSMEKLIEKHGKVNCVKSYCDNEVLDIGILDYQYHGKWHRKYNMIPVPNDYLDVLFDDASIEDEYTVMVGRVSNYLCMIPDYNDVSIFDEFYGAMSIKIKNSMFEIMDTQSELYKRLVFLLNTKNNNVRVFLQLGKVVSKWIAVFNMKPVADFDEFYKELAYFHSEKYDEVEFVYANEKYKKERDVSDCYSDLYYFIHSRIYPFIHSVSNSYTEHNPYRKIKKGSFFKFNVSESLTDSSLWKSKNFRRDYFKLNSLHFIRDNGANSIVIDPDVNFKMGNLTVRAGTNLVDIIRQYCEEIPGLEDDEKFQSKLFREIKNIDMIEILNK